ncbi:mechanosensitive ion channel protein MscS [Croceicoccus estronivorus]|uniref:mechanosensitive ion channel family protein n=1 Tax=Croceicoccus estronivorus TaxID=1172626 RepID=UPI0008354AC1|nr:mechanosensitive ion channel family protein [Croceicoccus estronivorus]OCC22730.1 mechanosensitive ion channel protein MscS [Croceicoccus estronivorus]
MPYADILREQVDAMSHALIAAIPGIAIAICVLLLTWLVSRAAVRITSRITNRTSLRQDLRQLSETLVRLGIWLIGLMIAAAIVMPGLTPASLVAGLGIGAVAIGFAFQDIFENFLAGVLIMLREKMQIGDAVEVDGILGKVERITLRETHIRQFSNELTILPNSTIFKNPVKILTDAPIRRNEIVVGVSYDTDLAKAESTIRKALDRLSSIEQQRGIDIYAQEFNSSSIDFLVRWWTDTGKNDFLGVKSEVVFTVKQALDDAGIEIPFPYVTHTFKDDVPVSLPAANAA